MLAIVGTVATGAEHWPLSQFELFSGVRTGESVSRQMVAVDDRGSESALDLSDLPANLGLVSHLLPTLRDEDLATQQQAMRLWLSAAGADDPEPVAVRVYVVRSTVPTVAGGRSAVLDRTLSYEVPLS